MSASPRGFAAALGSYRAIGLEGRMAEADPHSLITLLFDGAVERIELARTAIAGGDGARKRKAITAAIGIVEGLQHALSPAGGELTARLAMLYDYIGRLLVQANLKDDTALLAEAAGLLGQLRTAWAAMPREGSGS